ncbi:AzlD domain-containing protein [Frigidibacter sp. MR17.14]|uniref:AzlD domain-containing protein n=1 Tax=Frigidibacter sp. MR17.14 TaxID=3126509 RepID=UPI003012FD66
MSDLTVWGITIALGIGTFLLRYSFLGLVGGRQLPAWALRHLRYTAVAVLPALVVPMVVWPAATGGQPDPARLIAAAATVAVGMLNRGNALWTILGGMGALYLGLWLIG